MTHTAHQMGIEAPLESVPAEAIGGLAVGVTPLEMADGYATLASGGVHHEPTALGRVEFPSGKVDEPSPDSGDRVLTEGQAYEVTKLLEGVITQGTGAGYTYMGCGAEAGKTGTSEGESDAWFAGYTPLYSTAVWVGHPQSREATGFGGPTAGPIWRSFMESAVGRRLPRIRRTVEPARTVGPRQRTHLFVLAGSQRKRRIRRRRRRRTVRKEEGRRQGRRRRSRSGAGIRSRPRSAPGPGARSLAAVGRRQRRRLAGLRRPARGIGRSWQDEPVPAIETERLTKFYGAARGIEDVTLAVEPGEVFGFLGPNGAGKTTTIRTLLDLLHPSRGSARIFGLDSRRDSVAIRARLGNLPGDFGYGKRSSGREALALLARLRGVGDLARAEELARRFRADLERPLGQLSRGNRQKVGLILAVFHQPELLILDEPTGGLDPLMQEEFLSLVREERERGCAVFLSSHELDEVERVCDRVGIIRGGRLIAVERVADLLGKTTQRRRVEVEFAEPADLARVRALPGVVGAEYVHPTLEQVFLTYYEEGPR